MKNTFLKLGSIAGVVGCLLGLSHSSAQAQASGNVTLTVTLSDVLALSVNDGAAALKFISAEDYQDGVSDTRLAQLIVTSNKAYDLKVKAGGDLTNGGSTIPISNVAVRVQNEDGMGTTPSVNLSTTDQNIATNAPAAILKNVGLVYSTSAANSAFLKAQGSYTATLIYSLAAL